MEWNPAPFVGIHGSIDDVSIAHLCLNQANVTVTLSPPCPTWSRAGESQGLCHEGGWAFMEALQLCFVIQPVFIAAECVEDITTHPHFGYIQDFLAKIGYAVICNQVTSHHQVSNHSRSRWLCTWVRKDIDAMPFGGKFTPTVFPRKPWNSEIYAFPVPAVWADQLRLSPSELDPMLIQCCCLLPKDAVSAAVPLRNKLLNFDSLRVVNRCQLFVPLTQINICCT